MPRHDLPDPTDSLNTHMEPTALYRVGAGVRPHANAAGFDAARRLSIERLRLAPGNRVLIVGAGTGLDLPHVPSDVDVTAVDVTPAMLKRLEQRAAITRRSMVTRIMDARLMAFADSSFDAVLMHLILAVMPEPERGLREAARILKL
jgi:phosphatidylethanolamine/phosphatidyl-N-methylethanolamine N-methyltransferase